jgi:PAS domain-containing protein
MSKALPSKDGGVKYIYRTLQPQLNENGEDDFVVVCGIDITKQVVVEKNKQLLNKRFEKIINEINNAVFQVDFSGKIIFVNKAAFELFPFFEKTQDGYYRFINTSKISYADRLQCLRPYNIVKKIEKEVSGIFKIGIGSDSEKYMNSAYWYCEYPRRW